MIEWMTEHALWLLLGAAGVFTAVWLWMLRPRLRMSRIAVILFSLAHLAAGVGCVKVFAAMEAGDVSGVSGMSLFGAVFFLPLFYFTGAKITKRKAADVFDIFGVAMIATLFFARINCLIAGCCKGLSIHGLEPARWPTREAELVFYVVFLAIMAPKVFKDKTKGLLYPIYMIAYGVFRFAIEFFRESGGGRAWHIAHLWAFLAAAIGISVAAEMWAIKKRRANPQ